MFSVLLFVMKTKIHAKLNVFVHKPQGCLSGGPGVKFSPPSSKKTVSREGLGGALKIGLWSL